MLYKPVFRFNSHLACISQKSTENPLKQFKIICFHYLKDDFFLIETSSFLLLHQTSQGFSYSGIQCSGDSSNLSLECYVCVNDAYSYVLDLTDIGLM